jgi:hypothetical protein
MSGRAGEPTVGRMPEFIVKSCTWHGAPGLTARHADEAARAADQASELAYRGDETE